MGYSDKEISPLIIGYVIGSLILTIVAAFLTHSGFVVLIDFFSEIFSQFNILLSMDSRLISNERAGIIMIMSFLESFYISRAIGKLNDNPSLVNTIMTAIGNTFTSCFFVLCFKSFPVKILIVGFQIFMVVLGGMMFITMAIRIVSSGISMRSFQLICIGFFVLLAFVLKIDNPWLTEIMDYALLIGIIILSPVIAGFTVPVLMYSIELELFSYLFSHLSVNPVILTVIALVLTYPIGKIAGILTDAIIEMLDYNGFPIIDVLFVGLSLLTVAAWLFIVFNQNEFATKVETNEGVVQYTIGQIREKGEFGYYGCWELYDDGTLLLSSTDKDKSFSTDFGSSGAPWYEKRDSIKKVIIDSSLMTVPENSFVECENLETIYVSDSVNEFSVKAVDKCYALTSIEVDPLNQLYSSYDGCLYDKSKAHMLICATGKKNIDIPSETRELAKNIRDCIMLETINVNSDNQIFSSDDGIVYSKDYEHLIRCPIGRKKNVKINQDTRTIDECAFQYCHMNEVTIPRGCETLGPDCFYSCEELTKVVMPDSIKKVDYGAFYENKKLKRIVFTGNMPRLHPWAFYGDDITIVYPGDNKTWGKIDIILENTEVTFEAEGSTIELDTQNSSEGDFSGHSVGGQVKIPFTYKAYNDFFSAGYPSVTYYTPDEWALVDLDGDDIPEILFKENSDNYEGIFEVCYFNEQTGTVESAGSFFSEYYEVVMFSAEKNLMSIDASKSSLKYWLGYPYANHSIGWSFSLSAMTNPGSNPRTYSINLENDEGQKNLGEYEYDDREQIFTDYFGDQVEIEFNQFYPNSTWDLPSGILEE